MIDINKLFLIILLVVCIAMAVVILTWIITQNVQSAIEPITNGTLWNP